jgi:diadenosine tetraphosphatase ApaH/serine/threonine PP2A family protein phosphatase
VRVAVVSDVHGNCQALEAVIADVQASQSEDLWCLGDIVGYGADPQRCIELIRQHASVCLAGNHDLGVLGKVPIDEFSDVARSAALWTREQLSEENREFLLGLEPQDLDQDVGLYHASPRDPVWEYVLSPLQAELCFEITPLRVNLVGHTHVALEFHRFEDQSATGETRAGGKIVDIADGHWLLNPGSVGQPRDGDPRAAWLELDTDHWTAIYHRVEYDIDGAMWAIRAARLPEELATRLERGQ